MASASFHFLDVGQGDGTFIIGPGGENILVDFGSTKNRGIAPPDAILFMKGELEKRNPPTLELMVLTHGDQDHYNQILKLFAAVPDLEVNQIIYSGDASDYSVGGFYRDFLQAAVQAGIAVACAAQHTTVMNAARDNHDFNFSGLKAWILAVNYPQGGTIADSNPQSIVLLFEYGQDPRRVILTGDATALTEGEILGRYAGHLDLLEANVVKVPHHGSETSSSVGDADDPGWVDTVKAKAAITSSDNNPGYKLPRCHILDRYLPYLDPLGNLVLPRTYVCWDADTQDFEEKQSGKLQLTALFSKLQGVQYGLEIDDAGNLALNATEPQNQVP